MQVGTGEAPSTLAFYQSYGFSPSHRISGFFIHSLRPSHRGGRGAAGRYGGAVHATDSGTHRNFSGGISVNKPPLHKTQMIAIAVFLLLAVLSIGAMVSGAPEQRTR